MKRGIRHPARRLVAGLAVLTLSAALLGYPAHSRGAGGGGNPSHNVAVVPGFAPAPYNPSNSVPALPVNAPELAKYNFSQLPADAVTTAALQNYDTVILYGIRWSDIPSSGQAALNAFAAKHKVAIWDSDATAAQSYSNFIHPFSTLSSGPQYHGKPSDSVVYFPTGVNFLASSNPSSPYYLDPQQLVTDQDELNDMNAMQTGTANWRPALRAANHGVPGGGWPIAWSYGVIGDHTGLTIYSGLDADAFPTARKLNNDRKELALDLAAPFRSTPDSSCAPGCHLPRVNNGPPFASCGFSSVSRHWAHGRVPVVVKTSLAHGITVRIVTKSGRVIASASEQNSDLVPLSIPTTGLPNRASSLRVLVLVDGQVACTNRFQLVKNNHRPGLLLLAWAKGKQNKLTLRLGETSLMKLVAPHLHWRMNQVKAHKVADFRVRPSVRQAKLILRNRAGNTLVQKLAWR